MRDRKGGEFMKRNTVILCLSLVFLTIPAFGKALGNLRYSISVAKFENRANLSGQVHLPNTLGSILTDKLQQSGKFIVIGEKDMRKEVMNEQGFAAMGVTADGKKKPEIGKMTPAQLLVKGEITYFQQSTTGGDGGFSFRGIKLGGSTDHTEINITIYIVDTTTGQVVASEKVVGEAHRTSTKIKTSNKYWKGDLGGFKKTNVGEAVEKAVDQAVAFIIKQLDNIPWEGTVLLVKDSKVYLNRGSREGVSAGQTFTVGELERLTDPDTGELLDVTVNEVGTVRVEEVKDKISIAQATEGKDRIVKGMTVVPVE